MFVIMIPIEDLVEGKMFAEREFTEFRLAEQLTEYYSYGPYRPLVRLEDGMAIVEVDDGLITRDEAGYRKAVELCEKGRFKEASASVKKLLDSAPTVSEYNRLYGQILSELGDLEGAVRYLSEAAKWDYNNKWAFIMLGNVYAKHFDDLDKALQYYDRAMKIDPENNILINNIGANLASRGKFDQALEYLRKAMSIDPDYPNTHYGIALIRGERNENEAAFEGSIACLKLCKSKDALYGQALQLALGSAMKIV